MGGEGPTSAREAQDPVRWEVTRRAGQDPARWEGARRGADQAPCRPGGAGPGLL